MMQNFFYSFFKAWNQDRRRHIRSGSDNCTSSQIRFGIQWKLGTMFDSLRWKRCGLAWHCGPQRSSAGRRSCFCSSHSERLPNQFACDAQECAWDLFHLLRNRKSDRSDPGAQRARLRGAGSHWRQFTQRDWVRSGRDVAARSTTQNRLQTLISLEYKSSLTRRASWQLQA